MTSISLSDKWKSLYPCGVRVVYYAALSLLRARCARSKMASRLAGLNRSCCSSAYAPILDLLEGA